MGQNSEAKSGIEGDLYVFSGTTSLAGTIAMSGSRMAFVTGAGWNWDNTVTPVFDRGTASHWKTGRGNGELTCPQTYVDNGAVLAYIASRSTGSSAPRIQAEIRVYGSDGAGGFDHSWQFSDIQLKHQEMKEAEGDDLDTFSLGFDLMKIPVRNAGTGARIQ